MPVPVPQLRDAAVLGRLAPELVVRLLLPLALAGFMVRGQRVVVRLQHTLLGRVQLGR